MKYKNAAKLFIIGVSMLSLVCCSKLEEVSRESTTVVESESIEITSETTTPAVMGSEYNVGDFSFTLPEGWTAFPVVDIMQEKDAEGKYPNSTAIIHLSRESDDKGRYFLKPYVSIQLDTSGTATDTAQGAKDALYTDVTDFSMNIQGIECAGFSGTSVITTDYVDDYIVYEIDSDGTAFVIIYPTSIEKKATGLSRADSDMSVIFDTLTLNTTN